MNFYILTLFPQMVEEGLHTSIIGRAVEAGMLHIETVDIRRDRKSTRLNSSHR